MHGRAEPPNQNFKVVERWKGNFGACCCGGGTPNQACSGLDKALSPMKDVLLQAVFAQLRLDISTSRRGATRRRRRPTAAAIESGIKTQKPSFATSSKIHAAPPRDQRRLCSQHKFGQRISTFFLRVCVQRQNCSSASFDILGRRILCGSSYFVLLLPPPPPRVTRPPHGFFPMLKYMGVVWACL